MKTEKQIDMTTFLNTLNQDGVKAIFLRYFDGVPMFALSEDPRQDEASIPDWLFFADAAYCRNQFGKGWKRLLVRHTGSKLRKNN